MRKPEWKAVNARLRNERARRQETPQPLLITNCLTPVNLRVGYTVQDPERSYLPKDAMDDIAKKALKKELADAITQYWDIRTYEFEYGTEYIAGVTLLMRETLQ